ncbi:hypothetical protein RJ641_000564 [Dillenia turbinata]|uniref:Ubiquitin-like domain-containing protein n=1 Tax=Dillenia turbinata TaxID=194707 RepID=A0AAN8WE81_9MAGN
MGSSSAQVSIFVNTSMGTRIAISVSPDITVGDFKRELEREHFCCFPMLGQIKIYGLMVKRRSCFYHLPESMPIKYAFSGLFRSWFVHTEARPLSITEKPCLSNGHPVEVGSVNLNKGGDASDITGSLQPKMHYDCSKVENPKSKNDKMRRKRLHDASLLQPRHLRWNHLSRRKIRKKKKKRLMRSYKDKTGFLIRNEKNLVMTTEMQIGRNGAMSQAEPEEWNSNPEVEVSEEKSSEVSVSGIIQRYFSYYGLTECHSPSNSDVTSRAIANCTEEQFKVKVDEKCSPGLGDSTNHVAKTPQRKIIFPDMLNPRSTISREGIGKLDVGKRLIMASGNLGMSLGMQRPEISCCRSRDRKLLASNHSPHVKTMVFEIEDTDD